MGQKYIPAGIQNSYFGTESPPRVKLGLKYHLTIWDDIQAFSFFYCLQSVFDIHF